MVKVKQNKCRFSIRMLLSHAFTFFYWLHGHYVDLYRSNILVTQSLHISPGIGGPIKAIFMGFHSDCDLNNVNLRERCFGCDALWRWNKM